MLSGLKFLSKDQINQGKAEEESDDSRKDRRKSGKKKNKDRKKHRSTKYSSSDDEGFEKISKRSRKKKWYSSEESASSDSSEDDSEYKKKRKRDRKKKKKHSPGEYSSDEFESEKGDRSGSRKQGKSKHHRGEKEDDGGEGGSTDGIDIVRKEMGLEWMLRPEDRTGKNEATYEDQQEKPPVEEKQKANPKELNPYLRDNGSGYPEEDKQNKLLSSSLVGDGGASWRLKALKRAKEQAEREGQKLDEVVKERWGSLGHLAVSVSSRAAAPSRAHLHAIRSRQMGQSDEHESDSKSRDKDSGKRRDRDYLKDVSRGRPEMRAPKIDDSLSWRKKDQNVSKKDDDLISSAVSSINKFANDGNFLSEVMNQHKKPSNTVRDSPNTKTEDVTDMESDMLERKPIKDKPSLSANQLAAKAMQLRMKGQHEEAEKLLQEAENAKAEEETGERLTRLRNQSSAKRYAMRDIDVKRKQKEDDSDVHLAQTIMKNKQYSLSGRADDEYEYDDGGGPSKKSRKKDSGDQKRQVAKQSFAKRIATQQERCLFCFENPNRPKHLVVAIANFTYLMLPQRQPLVPGHCCILPLQHESATRSVDDEIWEEIRNFKKCLIMMFAKQEKDVVFLETVMGLAQQRRHCLIECIPVPQDIAKEAPLYFKKAIDEAEEEWSQHNAKRLIDTSQKGLRGSIPKNFPYFHVEFGLNRGFVHVIDDETQFNGSLGLNVIRGMLKLPEEDMYRKRRYEAVEAQKQAVAAFSQDWEPFDWTKQL